MTVTHQLRNQLKARLKAGETLYAIAKATDMQWATLKRFAAGTTKTGFRSENLDALAKYLGMELVVKSD